MRISRILVGSALALGLTAAAAPPPPSAPVQSRTFFIAGTYNWYESDAHIRLVGYQIIECDGTVLGPYPGPGGTYAEITPYEEYIPLTC